MSNDPQNSQDAVPLEVLQPSALHALESAHIDVQVKTAHQYPRDLVKFKKRALDMVMIDEETAESCIYCRPVGKQLNEKTGRYEEKFAEGPSIRMAEIVSASYGNIRIASRIIEQTERYVKCEGVCHDLESNTAGKSECVEVTVDRNGKPYSERQRALMAKVCLSKAYRDATFRVVPRALCKTIFDKAKQIIAAADKPLAERIKAARAWISRIKVEEARVLAALSIPSWEKATSDHILTLTGLRTAISENDVTIDEAFPPLTKGPEDPQKPATTVAEAKAALKEAKKPELPKTPAEEQKPAEQPATATATTEPPKEAPPTAAAQAPAEPATQQAQQAPPSEANDDAAESLKSIQLMMKQNNVTEFAVMGFCKANKISKEGQKLADLAGSKLSRLNRTFLNVLDEIKKFPPF